MGDLPSNAPGPRLCHIIKWPDFDGYGFNLHADKTRPGQYIGKVDDNSPADVAGLREGDRIIEVNGVNIANENHKQVVQRIKAVSNETKLLVVDSEADRWYKDHNLVVRGDQENIVYKTSQRSSDSPESQKSQKSSVKSEKNGNVHEEDNKSLASSSSTHSEHSTQPQNTTLKDIDELSDKERLPALNIEDYDEELPPPPPPVIELGASDVPLDSDLSLEYDNVRFEHEHEIKIPKVYVEESHSLSSHSSTRSEGEDTSKADNETTATTSSLPESDPDQDRKPVSDPYQEDRKPVSDPYQEDRKPVSDPYQEDRKPVSDPYQEDRKPVSEPYQEDRKSPMSTTPSPPPSLNPEGGSSNKDRSSQNSSPSHNSSGLNLNMTVAEMKAHLATKKKFDPRKDSIDLKKKYQIVQNM